MSHMGIKFAYFIISNKICNAIDISQLLIEISSLQNPIGNVLCLPTPIWVRFNGLQAL